MSTMTISALGDGGSARKRPALVSAQRGEKAITGTTATIMFLFICQLFLTRSFDQKMFDFHGNCEYVLARGKMSRTDTFAVIVR